MCFGQTIRTTRQLGNGCSYGAKAVRHQELNHDAGGVILVSVSKNKKAEKC